MVGVSTLLFDGLKATPCVTKSCMLASALRMVAGTVASHTPMVWSPPSHVEDVRMTKELSVLSVTVFALERACREGIPLDRGAISCAGIDLYTLGRRPVVLP
jgi:hypothetical protein